MGTCTAINGHAMRIQKITGRATFGRQNDRTRRDEELKANRSIQAKTTKDRLIIRAE